MNKVIVFRRFLLQRYVLILLLMSTTVSQDNTTTTSDGFLLELFKSRESHPNAETYCSNLGGWLVRIKDDDMSKSVAELKKNIGWKDENDNYFIGLEFIHSLFIQEWNWNDGTTLTEEQEKWRGREGGDSFQDCAGVFYDNEEWFDSTCGQPRRFICQSELLTISTEKKKIISLKGETVNINLIITRRTGEVIDMKVYRDSSLIDTLSEVTDNQFYTIENSSENDAGTYKFKAIPKSNAYSKSANVNIAVHVPVIIENVSSTSIYSPVATGPDSVICTAYGIPLPCVIWQKNGVNITTEEGSGVYQDNFNDGKSVLSIDNALLLDQGTYTCHATNYVGQEMAKVTAQKDINLSVYGPPTIVKHRVEKCIVQSKVTIEWEPNSQTVGIKHRIGAEEVNSTNPVTLQESISNLTQTTLIENLESYTDYIIKITVCPDECIAKLYDSLLVTTGIGLPNSVSNATFHEYNQTCRIQWNWYDKIPLENTTFEIDELSTLVLEPTDAVQSFSNVYEIGGKPFLYEIEAKPNRIYSFTVTATTCAGKSNNMEAVGECVTDTAAPDNLVSPAIINEDSSTKTQEIQISIPAETNGPVSCIFVLMKSGESTTNTSEFTQDQLNQAVKAATTDKLPKGVEYLAMAITRSNIDGTKTTVVLGDESESACNADDNTIEQKQRLIRSSDDEIYRGKNWPLTSEETYTYYIVTSTPTNTRGLQFGKSKTTTFEHVYVEETSNNLAWIAGAVVGILVALVLIAVVVIRKKSHKPRNKDKNNAPTPSQSPLEDFVYENMRSTENESERNRLATSIPIEELKNYYEEMNAENGKKFLEEFMKLNLQAVTAFSTDDALQDFVKKKNRYKNILPYDATRVVLRGDGKESYINASYIHGYNKVKKFIATQGPLSTTVDDFWQMIVEQRSRIIVMLTKCTEAGKKKCEQYWPDLKEIKRYAAVKVTCDVEMNYGGYTKRTFTITGDKSEPYTVEQYHFKNWPDHGILLTTSSFFRFYMACMESYSDAEWPMIVHCSAGAGRTGAFIGFDYLLEETRETQHVDIYECVLKMRQQRIQMVQTCDQYKLLHKFLLESHLFGNTDSDHTQIKEKLHQNRKKQIQEEFINIAVSASISRIKELQNDAYNDVTRSIQSDEGTIPRINSHKIETYDEKMRMIAAEGPTVSTVEYFWRAILDNDVTLIVMLNEVGRNSESIQYWPSRKGQCGIFGKVSVQWISSRPSRHFVERHFSVACGSLQKAITQYQVLGWRSDICSEDPSGVLDVINRIRQYSTNSPSTTSIMVHCNNGIGRTGVFCALFNIVERLKIEERADIFRTVKDLKDCRPGMVQNLDQYTFCYRAANLWLDSDHGYEHADGEVENPYENVRERNDGHIQYENMPVRV